MIAAQTASNAVATSDRKLLFNKVSRSESRSRQVQAALETALEGELELRDLLRPICYGDVRQKLRTEVSVCVAIPRSAATSKASHYTFYSF